MKKTFNNNNLEERKLLVQNGHQNRIGRWGSRSKKMLDLYK